MNRRLKEALDRFENTLQFQDADVNAKAEKPINNEPVKTPDPEPPASEQVIDVEPSAESGLADEDIFFLFYRQIILGGQWRSLSRTARAVYPVLGCYANTNGSAFPGEKRLAEDTGTARKSVREGTRDLEKNGILHIDYKKSNNQRRHKVYRMMKPTRTGKGKYFAFYRDMIASGIWGEMKLASKNTYLVMMATRWWKPVDYYFEVGGISVEDDLKPEDLDDFTNEHFQISEFDFCSAGPGDIAELAGINKSSVIIAQEQLEDLGVIARSYTDKIAWKILRRNPGPR